MTIKHWSFLSGISRRYLLGWAFSRFLIPVVVLFLLVGCSADPEGPTLPALPGPTASAPLAPITPTPPTTRAFSGATPTLRPTPAPTATPVPGPVLDLVARSSNPRAAAIFVGPSHSCALVDPSELRCWGPNASGQLGNGATSDSFRPTPVTVLKEPASTVAPGYRHTCVLLNSGGVQCWGMNRGGVLGDGTMTDSVSPVDVVGLPTDVVDLVSGGSHTCALTTSGGVKCWGWNSAGMLGDGQHGRDANSLVPVDVVGLTSPTSRVTKIAAGGASTCALLDDGSVQCWGNNEHGQLGDGSTRNERGTPVRVNGLDGPVIDIAVGGIHTCALMEAGTVKCWGNNRAGQLGDGSTENSATPVDVIGIDESISALAAGSEHTCALETRGGVKCWGRNVGGQLGNGLGERSGEYIVNSSPVKVVGLSSGVAAIAGGHEHTCALTIKGGVKCWGANAEGQSGDGSATERRVPVDVHGISGDESNLVVTSELSTQVAVIGDPITVGIQIGTEGPDGAIDPTAIFRLPDTVDLISAKTDAGECSESGFNVVCLLDHLQAGRVTEIELVVAPGSAGPIPIDLALAALQTDPHPADGTTSIKALAVPAAASFEVLSISTGAGHTCAVTTEGSVKCWGLDRHGQLGNGPGPGPRVERTHIPVDVIGLASGVAEVSAGRFHTCARTTAGEVKCWGANFSGQLGDGTSENRSEPVTVNGLPSGAIAISTGGSHTCAVLEGGGVRCWGANDTGQLGDGTTTGRTSPAEVVGIDSAVVAISTSLGERPAQQHTCALTKSDQVYCWGFNSVGQIGDGTIGESRTFPVRVLDLPAATAISVGSLHSCALTTSGEVRCWGAAGMLGNGNETDAGTPVPVAGLSGGATGIDSGMTHTCAVLPTGGVQCWGSNRFGELGDNQASGESSSLPVPAADLQSNIQQVSAGANHSCVSLPEGRIKCWGQNSFGQLGTIPFDIQPTPIDVPGADISVEILDPPRVVLAGETLSYALRVTNLGPGSARGVTVTDDIPRGAGLVSTRNTSGTCTQSADSITCPIGDLAVAETAEVRVNLTAPDTGRATGNISVTGEMSDPIEDNNSLTWTFFVVEDANASAVSVAAGVTHTCAVDQSGRVMCWGHNARGELGDGTSSSRPIPVQVDGLSGVPRQVAVGARHSCALMSTGEVTCWGGNENGEIGIGTANRFVNLASIPVAGLGGEVVAISAQQQHTCALTSVGEIYCWGSNRSGQLGDGSTTNRPTPVLIQTLKGASAVSDGGSHTCALTPSGGVYCWGSSRAGQLGDGTTNDQPRPVDVRGLTHGVVAVSAGLHHTCALTDAGSVKCWGANSTGQLGDGSQTSSSTPVNVIGLHQEVVAIAAGGFHTCAILSDGSVRCWGANDRAQIGDGTREVRLSPTEVSGLSSGVVSLAAGNGHTCANTESGQVRCWGANRQGQIGDGTTTPKLVPAQVIGFAGSSADRRD